MLSRELEISLISAVRDAKKRRHEYVTLEHVFFALLHDPLTAEILEECDGDITLLKRQVDDYLTAQVPTLPEDVEHEPLQTLAFQRLMHRVMKHVQSSGKKEADGQDCFKFFLSQFRYQFVQTKAPEDGNAETKKTVNPGSGTGGKNRQAGFKNQRIQESRPGDEERPNRHNYEKPSLMVFC